MRLRRRTLLGELLGLSAAGWLGCSRDDGESRSREITVSAGPYLAMSSLYLGVERGYFKEAGLTVRLKQFPNTNQAIPLLASGRIDVAFGAISAAMINAVARGADLRIVAGREILSEKCPEQVMLYVSSRSFPEGLSDVRRLKGKRIAVRRSPSLSLFWLDTLLQSGGLTTDDVELARLRRSEAVAALVAGRVDAMLTSNLRFTHVGSSQGVLPSIPLSRVTPNAQYSYIIFGQRLLHGDVAPGVRFLEAYLRAGKEFLAGATPAFMDEYATSNGLDAERVRGACRETFRPDGEVQMRDVKRMIEWCAERKLIERRLRPDELVDHRFLDRLRSTTIPERAANK